VSSIDVLVPVTERNFNPKAYLAANPDVAAAGVDPLLHFRKFGLQEGRRQFAGDYLTASMAFRREKFRRFSEILTCAVAADTFPIKATGEHVEASAYEIESANGNFGPFVAEVVANPERNYLDLGCGLRHTVFSNCLYLEIYPSLTADLVVDPGSPYPIIDESFDGIGCFAVLEHTRKPWEVVSEIRRMLKRGGKVWIDWPFLQPVHGYPSHYFNATREGLRSIFEDQGFKIAQVDTLSHQGADHTITWLLGSLMRQLSPQARKKLGGMCVADLLSTRPGDSFWADIMAGLDEKGRMSLACGNVLTATKP
jgi:SAM-dependent methyltransferase